MELTRVQKDVLKQLSRGDDIPANIADAIDSHPKSVSHVLSGMDERSLVELGLVENKGRGVYRLTERGEETVEELGTRAEPC